MPKDFLYWAKQHDSNELAAFNNDSDGILWLKTKSIIRRGFTEEFSEINKIDLESTSLISQFRELYSIVSMEPTKWHTKLDQYIRDKNSQILKELDQKTLVNELYKVETFKWGADNQNDLGKYLVKRYVKDNQSYDYLIKHMDTGIMRTVQDYLVCSWYNHWSTILIEHLFKTHPIILPTIGQIKNVDFFVNEIPFDLKVTYLPVNFIEDERKKNGLRPELTSLKQAARKVGIEFNADESNLYYLLSERLKDNGSKEAVKALKEIKDFRLALIEEIRKNPLLLAKNLYERQSDFRFGAENRLFLILIDRTNFEDSWKLKRNVDLLQPAIHSYLDAFSKKKVQDLKMTFFKEGNEAKYPKVYEVYTDVLVIEK